MSSQDKTAAILLKPFRREIDALDREIVALLRERAGIIRAVASVKNKHDIPVVLQDRVDEVYQNAVRQADDEGDYVGAIYQKIIETSCDLEKTLIKNASSS